MKLFFSGSYWPEKLWQDYSEQIPFLLVSYHELVKYKKPETLEKHLKVLKAMKAEELRPRPEHPIKLKREPIEIFALKDEKLVSYPLTSSNEEI